MNLKIVKYDGLGNDYFIYDIKQNKMELNQKRVKLLCDRNFGAGADGILEGPFESEKGIEVRIWNSDGTEAEISGNGVQIFARYLKDARYVTESPITIQTVSGPVEVSFLENSNEIRVSMGRVSFWSDEVPAIGQRREILEEDMVFGRTLYPTSCCNVGNPNCVIPMKEISRPLVEKIGEHSECSRFFPNRINTQIMYVMDNKNIAIEIYERGSGYTIASGTGACASAAVAYRLGIVKNKLKVHMQGGTLEIEILKDWSIYMTGKVSHIGSMHLGDEFINKFIALA